MFRPCIVFVAAARVEQPRESQRSSQANRGWNFPIPPFNYIVKFKGIIRSIANSLQRWIPNLLLLPRSKAYSISPIFPRCTHIRIFRNIEFLSLEFVAKSGRIFRDKREYRSDIPSKRQSNPPPLKTFSSAKYFPYRDDSRSAGWTAGSTKGARNKDKGGLCRAKADD